MYGKNLKSKILQTNCAKCGKQVYVKIKHQNKMQIRKEKKTLIIYPKIIYEIYQEDIINGGYK